MIIITLCPLIIMISLLMVYFILHFQRNMKRHHNNHHHFINKQTNNNNVHDSESKANNLNISINNKNDKNDKNNEKIDIDIKFSKREMKRLKRTFALYDKDNSGTISRDEIKEILIEMNHNVNNDKFKKVESQNNIGKFDVEDENKDDDEEEDEKHHRQQHQQQQKNKGEKEYDRAAASADIISSDIMPSSIDNEEVEDKALNELLNGIDVDENGHVTFHAFAMMTYKYVYILRGLLLLCFLFLFFGFFFLFSNSKYILHIEVLIFVLCYLMLYMFC